MDPAWYYQQTKTCPVCGRRFSVIRPRAAACSVVKRDTDFRVVCTGPDPNLYTVWVCPHCGYAAGETTFEQLEPSERERVREALRDRARPAGTDGERTPEGAIAAYEQAIFLAPIRKLGPSSLAGLHLKLAWVYRSLGDEAREREHLTAARDLYRTAFDHERLGVNGKMSEATVGYLVGELSRRTGDCATAVNWFSRLVSDPRTKKEPQILNLAREQWHAARSQSCGTPEERDAGGAPEPQDARAEAAPDRSPNPPAPDPAPAPTTPDPAPAGGPTGWARGAHPALFPPAARARETRISSMVPLYRDQVEWLQKVVTGADSAGGRLMLPDVVRAVLDLAVLSVPPDKLAARTEDDVRRRLVALLFEAGEGGGPA